MPENNVVFFTLISNIRLNLKKSNRRGNQTLANVNIILFSKLILQMQLQETVDSASSTSSPYREMSLGWTLNIWRNKRVSIHWWDGAVFAETNTCLHFPIMEKETSLFSLFLCCCFSDICHFIQQKHNRNPFFKMYLKVLAQWGKKTFGDDQKWQKPRACHQRKKASQCYFTETANTEFWGFSFKN